MRYENPKMKYYANTQKTVTNEIIILQNDDNYKIVS